MYICNITQCRCKQSLNLQTLCGLVKKISIHRYIGSIRSQSGVSKTGNHHGITQHYPHQHAIQYSTHKKSEIFNVILINFQQYKLLHVLPLSSSFNRNLTRYCKTNDEMIQYMCWSWFTMILDKGISQCIILCRSSHPWDLNLHVLTMSGKQTNANTNITLKFRNPFRK